VEVHDRPIGGRLEELQPLYDPTDSMIGTTVRVAAIRDMALQPERRAEIIQRVKGIRTPEEAVAYVKEVEARLEQAGRGRR
jgi:hypothetical protein